MRNKFNDLNLAIIASESNYNFLNTHGTVDAPCVHNCISQCLFSNFLISRYLPLINNSLTTHTIAVTPSRKLRISKFLRLFISVAVPLCSLYGTLAEGFFYRPSWQFGQRCSPRNLTCVPYTGSRYRRDPGIKRFHAKKPVHQGVPLGRALALCEKSRSTGAQSCLQKFLREPNYRS